MGELRRKYGFWGTVGHYRLRHFLAPEFIFGLLLGGAGAWGLLAYGTPTQRHDAAADFLIISGALIGVVFAGFALVIAFLSDAYLRVLEDTAEGVAGFMRPFMFSTGLLAGTVLLVVAYRSVGSLLPAWAEATAFTGACILFVTALLDIVALARTVMMHGVARGRASGRSEGTVASLEVKSQSRRRG